MKRKAFIWLVTFLFTLPFAWMILMSLAGRWVYPDLFPTDFTLEHWGVLGTPVWEDAATSLGLGLAVSLVSTALGFWTAWKASRFTNRRTWLVFAYFPYAFSPVIYAWCLRYFFLAAGLSGTFAGVWLGQVIVCYPFAFLLFFNHFDPNMQAMEALGRTLGGSGRQVLFRVLIPVSRGLLQLCFIQVFLLSWFEYGLTSVIGLGQVRTLTVAVFQYIGESNPYLAAAAGVVICVPVVVVMYWRDGIGRKLVG